MLMKLLITALAIGAAIGETDSSNLRGRELADTKKVCIYLGRKFGSQTFDVPSEKFRFYISSSRVFPAASGECDPDLVKNLSTEDLRIKKFCRLFKHTLNEYWTVDAISAATDWMLANEFEQGSCTNKNTYGTLHMEHLKEVNQNKFDDLYEELVDLMSNFTYEELLDAEYALYDIWDGNYTGYRGIDRFIDGERTCRDGTVCYTDDDCFKGGSCQNRNDRRE